MCFQVVSTENIDPFAVQGKHVGHPSLTLVFSLAIVGDLVSVQRGSLTEILTADMTDVWLLPCVDIFVVQQLISRGEQSGTDQALVLLVAVVSQLICHCVGNRLAILTVKATVSLLLVASQLGVAWKLPVGLVAVLYIAAVAGGDLGLFD